MKKHLLFFFIGLFMVPSMVKAQTFTWNPEFFNEDEMVTLTVSNFDPIAEWGVSDIYLWAWHFDTDGNQINNPDAIGFDFGNSPETAKFTNNGDGTYTYDFGLPINYFDNTGIAEIGYLIKSQDGSSQTGDQFKGVGRVVVNIISPEESTVFVNSGDNLSVTSIISFQGEDTVQGSFEIFYNDVLVDTGNCSFPNCVGTVTNITESGTVRVEGTPPAPNNTEFGEATLEVVLIPTVVEEALPANLIDGINYSADATRATLVLTAPQKEFIQVAGSWNNFTPSNSDLMKRDPGTGKYWLEITGLTPGVIYTYQYWVYDLDPAPESEQIVKTADPYSTLVLDANNDQFISDFNFPNLPAYPVGQGEHVTVLQTDQPDYTWQSNSYVRPDKENLVVYEMHIRDFTETDSFLEAITYLDYLENLGVTAIELMPVSQFDGNDSWGYNPTFHMALDKAYGTKEHFKQFVDECHSRGMAVLLDVVYNQAHEDSPLAKMYWNQGAFKPASDSPYLNEDATHPFNVFFDFNHESTFTKDYVKTTLEYWIEEFRIDGFRFDLSKGFTQTNSGSNVGLWGQYDASRVATIKDYGDYLWSVDPDSILILEHFADNDEETELANYGFMFWGNLHGNFKQNGLGFPTDGGGNTDISWLSYQQRGWNDPHVLGYMESHDEERQMVDALQFGNSSGSYDVTDFSTSLDRMKALAVVFYSVPGPKMLWQFGELGYDFSINYCTDGSINSNCRTGRKPVAWSLDYDLDTERTAVFDVMSTMINLKVNNPTIFNTGNFDLDVNGLVKRINLYDENNSTDVVVLANFDVVSQDVNPNFPSTGEWYEVFTDQTVNISSTSALLNLQPGEYRLYSQTQNLSTEDLDVADIALIPNPVRDSFTLTGEVSNIQIYDITGKKLKSFNGAFTVTDSFDISSFNTGMYIVKMINSNNQTITTKLVKL